MLAFMTVKFVGKSPSTRTRIPVNVKKFPSILFMSGGTKKSEVMSASPAKAIWAIVNEDIRTKRNFKVVILEAMVEKLMYRSVKPGV